jgi:hypothetical protein
VVLLSHFEAIRPKPTRINLAAVEIFEIILDSLNTWVTLVGFNFLSEIMLVDFLWEWDYKLECVNKTFISHAVWVTPVDTSTE